MSKAEANWERLVRGVGGSLYGRPIIGIADNVLSSLACHHIDEILRADEIQEDVPNLSRILPTASSTSAKNPLTADIGVYSKPEACWCRMDATFDLLLCALQVDTLTIFSTSGEVVNIPLLTPLV